MSKFTFSVEKTLATLSTSTKGWKKELNLVSWNGLPSKYDIREWDSEYQKMGKGVTLSEQEMKLLYAALKEVFEGESGEQRTKSETISSKHNYWKQHSPLFVQELSGCIQYMHSKEYSFEDMKQMLLGKETEGAESNILNEIESLSTIYFGTFEEFKVLLEKSDAGELKVYS